MSVLIPTRNKPDPRTLDSVSGQSYHNIEVIVIKGPRERSRAVNEAATKSKGKYLYRIDDDFLLGHDVVREAVRAAEGGADAVLIHNTSDPTVSRWAAARKLERDCFRDDSQSSFVRFVRRDVFFKLGGFREDLFAGEDRDFHERLVRAGYRVRRVAPIEVHLGEPRTLADVVRSFAYYGSGWRLYGRKSELVKVGPVRRAFIRHRRELLRDPRRLMTLVIYEAVRYVSELIGLAFLSVATLNNIYTKQSFETVAVVVPTKGDDFKIRIPGVEETIVVKGGPSLARARNLGASLSDSDLVLFYDDDNVPDPRAVDEMRQALRLHPQVGVASPVIYHACEPSRVWFAGGHFNPVTGVFGVDKSVPRNPRETGTFHDVFMVRRDALNDVGGFDRKWFPFYLAEADWAERAKKKGWRFIVVPTAKVYHDIPLEKSVRTSHMASARRAYYVGRNKLIFLRRHRSKLALLFYSSLVLPSTIFKNLLLIAKSGKPYYQAYLRGAWDGLSCSDAHEPGRPGPCTG